MAKSLSEGHFGKIIRLRKMKREVKLGFSIDSLILWFCYECYVSMQWSKTMLLKSKNYYLQGACCYGKMIDIATKIPSEIYEE